MITSGHFVSHSTEKAAPRRESPLSDYTAKELRSRFDVELDTFDAENAPPREFTWNWPRDIWPKRRLTVEQAKQTQAYINHIIRRDYPYHIRWMMGTQLWREFCEYYAVNPDFEKSMRYL